MKTVILDLETNGLYQECTKIWCAVAYEIENDKYVEFTPDTIKDLPTYLNTVDLLSCHNGVGFDLKVIKKILNYEFTNGYEDTLLMSRILWPDIEAATYRDGKGNYIKAKGTHTIEAWGVRLGVSKPVHEDWTQYSDEMLIRCRKDTEIQALLYKKIHDEIKDLSLHNPDVSLSIAIKMEHKVWRLMEEQADYGFMFDVEAAYGLVDRLSSGIDKIEKMLLPQLPMSVEPHPIVTKAFTANGELSSNALKAVATIGCEILKYNFEICGDFQKVAIKPFNIASEKDLKEYLLEQGWKPAEWNFKKDRYNKPMRGPDGKTLRTSPKLPKTAEEWDEVAETLGNQNVKLIADFNKAHHRKSQIEGLIKKTRLDHRIEAQAITCATNTARMVHRQVVNIPKNDPAVFFGKEMRSLFITSSDKILIGCDASALEARCEAHYIYRYDPDAALKLIDGDIHTANAEVWGVSRNLAKSGKYALLYGCSASKLATVLNKPMHQATKLYEAYLEANPAVRSIKEDLETQFDKYGYIIGIDGRPLTIRYRHALLNSLLQSCGSIAMKYALCSLESDLNIHGIWHRFVGNFHDEMIFEVTPERANKAGGLAVESIAKAGQMLKMNVPLTGESKIGRSWAETH
jgi:hypothetical protein